MEIVVHISFVIAVCCLIVVGIVRYIEHKFNIKYWKWLNVSFNIIQGIGGLMLILFFVIGLIIFLRLSGDNTDIDLLLF